MTIQEIGQELFEMERKLKSMLNSCSQDLAIGIEKLRGELAELKESKKEGKWKPVLDKLYWYRGDEGINLFDTWENDEIDEWRRKNLKIFETEEECERYWHFMDTVKEKSYEFSKEEIQDSSIYKLSIGYVPSNNRFYISYDADCKYFGKIYFKTEEDAQYIIDNFKEELMEYWT